jgi:hypothetical protein
VVEVQFLVRDSNMRGGARGQPEASPRPAQGQPEASPRPARGQPEAKSMRLKLLAFSLALTSSRTLPVRLIAGTLQSRGERPWPKKRSSTRYVSRAMPCHAAPRRAAPQHNTPHRSHLTNKRITCCVRLGLTCHPTRSNRKSHAFDRYEITPRTAQWMRRWATSWRTPQILL